MRKETLTTINQLLDRKSFHAEIFQEAGAKWHELMIHWKNEGVIDSLTWKDSKTNLYDLVESVTSETSLKVSLSMALAQKTVKEVKAQKPKLELVKESTDTSLEYKDIPKVLDGFYMPDFKDSLVKRIRANRRVLLTGATGSGKSEMIMKIAKHYGVNCIRINFSSGVSESDLLGKYVVKNGETVFVDGYIPLAMKNGWWIILDEIDYAQPENISCLQAVLEGNDLVNIKNEGEIIKPHPGTRFFATANTKGRGDVTDSYNGTNFLNIAFLDRWTIFEVSYSKKEKEIAEAIIKDSNLSEKLVTLFSLLRKSVENGDLMNASFSTRRLLNVCEALKIGDSLSEALEYEVFNRYHKDEIGIIEEYVNDVFNKDHYLKKDWYLGMPHHVPMATAVGNEPPKK